jgi:hypothetical protein
MDTYMYPSVAKLEHTVHGWKSGATTYSAFLSTFSSFLSFVYNGFHPFQLYRSYDLLAAYTSQMAVSSSLRPPAAAVSCKR